VARSREGAAEVVDSLQIFLREIGHYSLLTREQEVALMQQVERGDRRAKERLINSNLRLVVSIAKRYVGVRARRLARAERELATQAGKPPPGDDEIAGAAAISIRHLRGVREAAEVVASLDQPVRSEGAPPLASLLADDEPDPFDEIERGMLVQAVRAAVDELPEGERRVIEARYGLDGDEPLTMAETRRRLRLGRNDAVRLERQALRRLAHEPVLVAVHEAA
jgi:DNA-directed RNA polymerase sigma subunit (sigma70/sigma32)